MKRYEGMFLFDNAAVHEWSEMEAEVKRLFERIEAEPLVCVKFDERKLAYEIKRRKRGTYVLTYFDADPQRITALELDARLSEVILRLLVLQTDKLTEERLAELKAHAPDQPLQSISSDGRRGDHGPRGRSEAPSAGRGRAPSKATETVKEKTEAGAEPAEEKAKEKTEAGAEPEPEKATAVTEEPVVAGETESTPQPTPEATPEATPAAEATKDKPVDE